MITNSRGTLNTFSVTITVVMNKNDVHEMYHTVWKSNDKLYTDMHINYCFEI